jgi:hypothetical protein
VWPGPGPGGFNSAVLEGLAWDCRGRVSLAESCGEPPFETGGAGCMDRRGEGGEVRGFGWLSLGRGRVALVGAVRCSDNDSGDREKGSDENCGRPGLYMGGIRYASQAKMQLMESIGPYSQMQIEASPVCLHKAGRCCKAALEYWAGLCSENQEELWLGNANLVRSTGKRPST